jgi:hypothetical protein
MSSSILHATPQAEKNLKKLTVKLIGQNLDIGGEIEITVV